MAPDRFEIDHYPGRTDSWKDFGLWISQLNKGQDVLGEETREHIKEMVSQVPDTIDKIRILYQYMQNKTRYVSIQVGIGGWQPFSAKTVDELSYGDCKALTNYMKSILEVAGIKSYYTLIRAGKDAPYLLKDFPSNQFNHAILCVPVKQDTIWLECTSQYIPFGFTGEFTDDREALVITDSGGVVVHTKIYPAEENTKYTTCTVTLHEKTNATAKEKTRYSGIFYDEMNKILHVDDQEKKKMISDRLDVPGFHLIGFRFEENTSFRPYLDQEINMDIQGLGTPAGDRIILPLNVFDREEGLPVNISKRETDIFIRRSYVKIDTIVYQIPKNYDTEKIPPSVLIGDSKFGSYSAGYLLPETR